MKKLSIFHVLGLALLVMMFNACETDPVTDPGPIFSTSPELSIVDEAGFIAFDETVSPDTDFRVKITATRGDSPLNAFYLQEDGIEVPSERFLVNNEISGANPKLIFGSDKEGLTWELTIRAHDTGTRNYRFIVEDEAGETSSQSLNISTDGGTPPLVEITTSGMIDVDPGALISLPVTVGQGTFPLASITVLENGVPISDFATRLFYDDLSNAFTSNPYPIPSSDVNGFQRTIFIRAGNDAGTSTYSVQLADDAGNITESSFEVTTGISGTPTTLLQGVLFNAAGPAGTGGLDLDTGNGTGSSDILSEIRDQGIDQSVPNDQNWIKRIAAINGTRMVFLSPGNGGLSETFTFESVEVKEQIEEIFAFGIELNTDSDGLPESFLMEVGDVYAAERDGTYYIFVVREINETPDSNADNYVFDIQY